MNLPSVFFIALRFFIESKRSMFLSALGVVFGVAFFITGQAQTVGFQKFFIDTILGSKGAIIITDRFQQNFTNVLEGEGMVAVRNQQKRKYYQGITNAYQIMDTIMEYPNVVACAPIVEGNASMRAGFRNTVVVLFGIDLDAQRKATDFAAHITQGDLDDFREQPDSICIGELLRKDNSLRLGDYVYLMDVRGKPHRFKITCIYETGVNAIDEKRVYVGRRKAQSLLGKPGFTSSIMVKLENPDRAPQDAQAFEELLSHRSRSWQEREKGNMQIFKTLRISAGLGISFILLLAGFGIFNVLTMTVMEKVKEIAILRSMGYRKSDVTWIFLIQGFLVALLGIVCGWVMGTGLTALVSKIPVKIRGILKADHFIVDWSFEHYLMAALLAFISVFIAAVIPARRAANIRPVNILRGSAQ
ncbi:MAG: ABC transporter permease [Verrucomicrobiota bacterium]